MAGWLVFLILVVWATGIAWMEYKNYRTRRHRPWEWAMRSQCKISFSEKEMTFFRWTWVLVPVYFVLFYLSVFALLGYSYVLDYFENKKKQRSK